MSDTLPAPGTPERQRLEETAAKLQAMAHAPVDQFERELRLRGFSAEHRAVILEAMGHHALHRATTTGLPPT